jgi:hypothetical protein
MTSIIQYSVKDFDNIIFKGIEYNLSSEVIKIIQVLENILNAHTEPTNDYYKSDKKRTITNFKPVKNDSSADYIKTTDKVDWKSIKPVFKATKIIEKTECIETDINQIRVSLNKISNKNYDIQRDHIIECIELFFEKNEKNDTISEEEKEENIKKITNAIFDIASSNKFYSELYAELYRDLIQKFQVFHKNVLEFIEHFSKTIDHIRYVDPKANYDESCAYLKKNDLRKATSTFVVNLMKKEIINKDCLMDIIDFFQNRIFDLIQKTNCGNEVEEITENVFILISQSHLFLVNEERWKNKIFPDLSKISKMKTKDFPSISNRVIFKYMDILDILKNQ